jgi:hypothetical protein
LDAVIVRERLGVVEAPEQDVGWDNPRECIATNGRHAWRITAEVFASKTLLGKWPDHQDPPIRWYSRHTFLEYFFPTTFPTNTSAIKFALLKAAYRPTSFSMTATSLAARLSDFAAFKNSCFPIFLG